MKIEVAHGEIIDKHTILVIKSERIFEKEKLAHVQVELEALSQGATFIVARRTRQNCTTWLKS